MVRLVAAGVLVACGAVFASAQGDAPAPPGVDPNTPTLAEAMATAGVDASGLPPIDLAGRVSDFAVNQSASLVVLAYGDAPGSAAPRTLHVRLREGPGTTWRHATIDAARHGAGAVTQIQPAGRWVLVDTRVDDRNDVLLVLDEALGVRHAVQGHLLAVLPDEVALLQDNTGRFAPTRPVLVSTCLLSTAAVEPLHPIPPWSAPRARFVERVKRAYSSWGMKNCIEAGHHCNAEQFDGAIASDVRVGPRGRDVAWVERLGPAEGAASGPVDFRTHVLVTCDTGASSSVGRCRERAFGSYDGPDGKATFEVLSTAFAAPGRH
jgi:hypothetical protein